MYLCSQLGTDNITVSRFSGPYGPRNQAHTLIEEFEYSDTIHHTTTTTGLYRLC